MVYAQCSHKHNIVHLYICTSTRISYILLKIQFRFHFLEAKLLFIDLKSRQTREIIINRNTVTRV